MSTAPAGALAASRAPSLAPMPPIPLLVLGGYLGSGKTTIINALLSNALGRRITVLVNDFGLINIDAALIRERSDDVIGLENGCVCCTIGGKLVETLLDISARETRPDLLVIEASGVSDPLRIAQVGMLDRAFRLQGIVVAVDAERIGTTLADPYIGDIARRQIESATALVLTKTDLIASPDRASARRRLREIAQTRIVFEARHGDVPPALLFTEKPLEREPVAASAAPLASGAAAAHLPANLRSFTFCGAARYERKRLKDACASFSARLLRAKGFVRLTDGTCAEIHVVGPRWHITPSHDNAIERTTIVLIGLFDHEEMQQALRALEAAASG